MRCPDCNKFVSYDDPPEVEVNNEGIAGDAGSFTLNAEVVIRLNCADCGTELKESSQEFSETFEHECEDAEDGTARDPDLDVTTIEGEGTSRTETTYFDKRTKTRKRAKSSRYWTTYYGATVNATVRCAACDEEIGVSGEVEEAASAFEEVA